MMRHNNINQLLVTEAGKYIGIVHIRILSGRVSSDGMPKNSFSSWWLRSCSGVAVKRLRPIPEMRLSKLQQPKPTSRLLHRSLKKAHPSLHLYLPEKRFDFLTDSLKTTITTTVTLNEFFNKLYCIVGRVGCSHTDLAMPPAVYDSLQNRQFFSLFPLNGSMVVYSLMLEDTTSARTEIRRINGKPAETIIRELMLYNSVEGLGRETQKEWPELILVFSIT
jgi:hypothetical protein